MKKKLGAVRPLPSSCSLSLTWSVGLEIAGRSSRGIEGGKFQVDASMGVQGVQKRFRGSGPGTPGRSRGGLRGGPGGVQAAQGGRGGCKGGSVGVGAHRKFSRGPRKRPKPLIFSFFDHLSYLPAGGP